MKINFNTQGQAKSPCATLQEGCYTVLEVGKYETKNTSSGTRACGVTTIIYFNRNYCAFTVTHTLIYILLLTGAQGLFAHSVFSGLRTEGRRGRTDQ